MNQPAQKNTLREFWQSHMARWKSSKLSQLKYCEQENLKYVQFIHWRSKLTSEEKNREKKRFMAVTIRSALEEKLEENPSPIEIKLSSGHTVLLPISMGMKEIITLIRSLGATHA